MAESLEVKIARLEERSVTMEGQLTTIGADIKDVRRTLTHQRGFVGGVVFAVSAVWVAAIALWQAVLRV